MPLSLKQFRQRLNESGLVSQADLQALIAELPDERRPADGEQLARLLVQQKKLSAFQAQQIYAGKGKALTLGNYVILDKLGQGGMGLVYKAEHRRMERQVALKVLSKAVTKDPEAARRFQREVKAAAKLEHPNVVTAYDADEAGGIHFLVMQFVDGTDLSVLVRQEGPLSVEQALGCVLQAARGLEYAHSRGVVHRDIKPSNLLLDREGTVQILDMGLARIESAGPDQDQLTGTGQIMGTIDYMAPEQAADTKTADARADVYSLGATLWYLLTGCAMYEADTLVKKLMAHQNNPLPSLRDACPGISTELEAVFAKMIAKTPDERYWSMTDLIVDLERCTGESKAAPPVASAPGEDTRLNAFLRGMKSSPGSAVAAKPTAKDAARKEATVSSGATPTMTFRSAHADTDPQTQFSLGGAASPIATRSVSEGATPVRDAGQLLRVVRPWLVALPRSRFGLLCIAGGGVVLATFAVLLATIVFFVRTKDGVIRVEIGDPSIEVAIKGTEIVLKQADNGTDVKLSPGDKTLIVQRGDFQFETDKLILKRGETVAVHVELLPGEIEVRQGDQIIGQGALPGDRVASWHGWPADAPAPAIAPFNAGQAKKHQEEWAEYLGVPVEWKNSIGMKFVLIPPGEFLMGSTPEEIEATLVVAGEDENWKKHIRSEPLRHKVILTQPFYLGVHEIRQAEYEKVMSANPSAFAATGTFPEFVAKVTGKDTAGHPVEMVSWKDAAEFCAKLSEKEQLKPFYFRAGEKVTTLDGTGYRLPTEAQWEFACRAGTTTKYWIGDQDEDLVQAGWFNVDSGGRTHAAGELKANPLGLFDIHGNVWEWVQDWWEPTYYSQFQERPALDPSGPASAGSERVIRGGGWNYEASFCRASSRYANDQSARYYSNGFRVALAVEAVKQAIAAQSSTISGGWHGWPADAPKPAIAPFNAEQAKKHQTEWADYLGLPVEWENSIGMKFILIPPGEFLMGSTPEEIEGPFKVAGDDTYWQGLIRSELPRHKVILTQPIYLGLHEVTQSDYESVMGTNPSHFAATGPGKDAVEGLDTSRHPVEMVHWTDAAEFCVRLSEKESRSPFYSPTGETLAPQGNAGYRLPTEALWEFAGRAGTTTKYCTGDDDEDLLEVAWIGANSDKRTHSVGELTANPFGLYDVHGNVWEWVHDWWSQDYYSQFPNTPAIDPTGPAAGSKRVLRGGDWGFSASRSRIARRSAREPENRGYNATGFRVALPAEAVRQELDSADSQPSGS